MESDQPIGNGAWDGIPLPAGTLNGVGVVGIGSLYARDDGGTVQPDGGAAAVSVIAVRSGAGGFAASRVGMDRCGRDIVDSLRAAGVDVQAIQTDPDLVTPRWIARGASVRLEPYAAFDTIQWDAEIEALARSAEIIVTDACGRRHGQSRSSIDRMLIAATNAVRIIDLTRRPPSEGHRLDREHVGQALELCDVFVVDPTALRTLVPAAGDALDAARRLHDLRRRGAVAIVPTPSNEGCVVSQRGIERIAARPASGARVAMAVGCAMVVGRAPHELVATL